MTHYLSAMAFLATIFSFSVKDSQATSSSQMRRERELSVENDYPELSLDFPVRSPGTPNSKVHNQSNQSQLLSRRLKLDLRNDCETVIAGRIS